MIPLLSHLPTFDPKTGDLTVVIETPKGSPNKYDYDSRYGAFRFAAVLPEGMSFPFDFGFVPSTLGDDGDPLDVLLLLDASTPVGCILSARLLGIIKARQGKARQGKARQGKARQGKAQGRATGNGRRMDPKRPTPRCRNQ
jgi:inorganic pyrophosphatase